MVSRCLTTTAVRSLSKTSEPSGITASESLFIGVWAATILSFGGIARVASRPSRLVRTLAQWAENVKGVDKDRSPLAEGLNHKTPGRPKLPGHDSSVNLSGVNAGADSGSKRDVERRGFHL